MSRGHNGPPGRILSTFAAISLLAVMSCGSSDDDEIVDPPTSDSTSTTSTSSTTSTTTTSSTGPPSTDEVPPEEALIIERYLGFWDARFNANLDPPNPDDPALAEYTTGAQLDQVVAETRQRRDDGLAFREAEPSQANNDVTVVSATDGRAELQACMVSDGVVYRSGSGEVVNDDIVTRNVSAVMVLDDGRWKLEQATVLQEWQGVGGCALTD